MKGVTRAGDVIEVSWGERRAPWWSDSTERRLPVEPHVLATLSTRRIRTIFIGLCSEAGLTHEDIAAVFSCPRRTVCDIVNRESTRNQVRVIDPYDPLSRSNAQCLAAREVLFARFRSVSTQEVRAILMAILKGAGLNQTRTAQVFNVHRKAIHRAKAYAVPELPIARPVADDD